MEHGKNGFIFSTRDRVLHAWLNTTELVRDFENYAKQITDCEEVSSIFGDFAEQQAIQASRLLELLREFEKKN